MADTEENDKGKKKPGELSLAKIKEIKKAMDDAPKKSSTEWWDDYIKDVHGRKRRKR